MGLTVLLVISFMAYSQVKGKGKKIEKNETGIHWISFAEAEQKMKAEPRKVIVDIYTDWCGWCKVLDKKTYSNPQLIEYVNKHFYAVKFNAEQKEPVKFLGKEWKLEGNTNRLAMELMNGRASYPTTVFMSEGFKDAQPVPGFLEVPQMEGIMKFIGEGFNTKMTWNDFQRQFKAEWKPL